jgi:hypothetical protein
MGQDITVEEPNQGPRHRALSPGLKGYTDHMLYKLFDNHDRKPSRPGRGEGRGGGDFFLTKIKI